METYFIMILNLKTNTFIFKKIKDKSNTVTRPIIQYFVKNGNPIGQSSVVVRKKLS